MIEITAEIRALIDKAAAGVELAGDEYIDPADGLIHCKKCGGQRQTVVPCFGKSGYFMPRCICQCQREAEEQRKAAEERQRRMERIKRRKAQGLQDRYLYDYTFFNDNGHINTRTNNSGGIQGGISNGQDIYFRVAFKSVATILMEQETVNMEGEDTILKARGRHDPCVLPRAVPIVESMTAMTLLDYLLIQKTRENF